MRKTMAAANPKAAAPRTVAAGRYLRFVVLRDAAAPTGLDDVALRLLDLAGCAAAAGAPMTVMQAMARADLASPATLHRKLRRLQQAGLVEVVFRHDRRTKYLMPTAAAQARFEQLGAALRAALDAG